MLTETRTRSRGRLAAMIVLAVLGTLAAYSLFYFLLFKPSLPPIEPEGERYMTKVKQGDWKGVAAMYANRKAGEEAVARWKELREAFGPVRSYEVEGSFVRTFPLLTQGAMAYTVKTDKGELFTIMHMKAKWGFWKLGQTETNFQPPQPFRQN